MSAHTPHQDHALQPKFSVGQHVKIRSAQVYTHIRTPWYTMGKPGVIERLVGSFPDAEKTAYGNATGQYVFLYRIRLSLRDLWDETLESEVGTLDVEIYEHWLEAI